MAVNTGQTVGHGDVFVEADVHAVTNTDAVTLVADDLVAPQQVVGRLVEGDAVGVVLVDLVVGNDVVDAVTVDHQAREFVVVAFVVEDEAVVDLTGNNDPVLLLGPVHRVVGNDQAVGTVVRVNAVDDVVFVGVALDHEVAGFIAVEAVPHVRELGADDPAGRFRTLEHLGHVRRVLGNTHPVRLTVGVTETGHLAVDDVGLGATPGEQERTEFLRRTEGRRAVVLFAPACDFGVTHKQLAVVDHECTGLLRQAQFLGLTVDFEDAFTADDDRQLRQVHARRGLAEVLLGQFLRQVLEVHVAVIDEDRLGDAVLTHHPFGHLVVAADKVLQRVFLHHPAHADFACFAADDFRRSGFGGVAGNVRQFRRGQVQRFGRRAADRVGLGLLQLFRGGHRFNRLHSREGAGAGQQHRAGQQAE
ncbi:hypothetical protein D3C86_699000 [compost metagenome]